MISCVSFRARLGKTRSRGETLMDVVAALLILAGVILWATGHLVVR